MLARTSCIGEAPGREGEGDSGTAAGKGWSLALLREAAAAVTWLS